MTKRYTGGVVSSSLPTVNAAGASGVFLLSQQSDYQSRNAWPPYKVEESLRFRGGSVNASLTRTPSVTSNRRTWTWSGWIKLGSKSDGYFPLFGADATGYPCSGIALTSFNIQYFSYTHPVYDWQKISTMVLRDSSAWYHIVAVTDTTNATAEDRAIVYVNGQRITSWSTNNNPSSSFEGYVNSSSYITKVGRIAGFDYFDGYMAEVNFVDGQALTPSSFGATDKDGNWSPIAYTGTYGTNGFYLNFKDNTSATTMGSDYSGNGNNLTLNNFNVSTANTSYDIMIDVPEDQDSANTRGNYAVLNPLAMYGTNMVISNAGLTSSATSTSNDRGWPSTIAAPGSGKWYAEFTFTATSGDNNGGCGVMLENGTGAPGESATTVSWRDFGTLRQNASGTTYGTALSVNDVVMVAYDAALGRVWFGKNGTWFASGDPATNANPSATGITSSGRFATYHYNSVATIHANFGQRPFAYAPPSGFKALNTFNLPEPTIKQPNKYFNAVLYSGNNSTQDIPVGFQPDFIWSKCRNFGRSYRLIDSVRGLSYQLFSESTDGGATYDATSYVSSITSTSSSGFAITNAGTDQYNTSGETYVSWAWNAGGSTVTNTSGSISSQVRASPTAGFSIVTYTGNGTSGATVGHGLGVTPSMVILKQRDGASNWQVKHVSLNANQNLVLNSTAAVDTAPGSGYISAISSTTLTLLNGGSAITNVNANNGTYVAYCFAPIAGYSAFGSYTGNASTDGPFVYTGFRPKWVMVKNRTSTQSWQLMDSARSTYNAATANLLPNSNTAELTGTDFIDMLSNGFKIRQSSAGNWNNSGDTYIYIAFAEAPFKYARSR